MTDDRVTCQTPTPGKQPTRIPRWKYDAVSDAILTVLRQGDLAFKELPAAVDLALSDDVRTRLGSIGWHVTTVKLDLEVRGLIARVPGVTPQLLTLVRN